MPPETLKEAVARIDGRAVSEASGRVDAASVTAIAEAGVDYISVGRITHSAPCLDLGLDIEFGQNQRWRDRYRKYAARFLSDAPCSGSNKGQHNQRGNAWRVR